jgi:hypothetical protein
VDAADADALAAAVLQLDLQVAVFAERQLVLADLVALGQVGIGVILARKDRQFVDRAVERQPGLDRRLDRGAVDHRQRAGQRQAGGAGARVGRRALVVRGAAAEHLGAGERLGVNFHAHDKLEFGCGSRFYGHHSSSHFAGFIVHWQG